MIDLSQTVWGQRIAAAQRRGWFTDEDNDEAASWVTCACGRITADIERSPGLGVPRDGRLRMLGTEFCVFVGADDFAGARRTLEAIELRAIEVAAGR